MKSTDRVLASKYASAYASCLDARTLFEQPPVLKELGAELGGAEIFSSPAVPKEEKKKILAQIISGGSGHLKNLLFLLADNKKIYLLPEIAAQLQKIVDAKTNTLRAKITTAQKINPSRQKEIEKNLKEIFKASAVEARYDTDGSLIGGFTAQTPEVVLDATLKNNFEKLKQLLEM